MKLFLRLEKSKSGFCFWDGRKLGSELETKQKQPNVEEEFVDTKPASKYKFKKNIYIFLLPFLFHLLVQNCILTRLSLKHYEMLVL